MNIRNVVEKDARAIGRFCTLFLANANSGVQLFSTGWESARKMGFALGERTRSVGYGIF
jgi:hypothetical protein